MQTAAACARQRSVRSGFSLIELTLSLGVMSVLLVAVASTITFASRALPAASTESAALGIDGPFGDMLAEASMATQITAVTETSITFLVADRDNDGDAESIAYSWAGMGTPLRRQLNADPATGVTAPLGQFQVALTTETGYQASVGTPVDGAEQLLAAYTGPVNSTVQSGATRWVGQYFKPLLPADATQYSVTRVRLMCRRDQSGTSIWSIRNDAGGQPASTSIQSQSVTSGSFSTSDNWYQVTYNNVTGITPTNGLWLVLHQTLGRSCEVSVATQDVPSRRAQVSTSTSLGLSWSASPSSSLKYEIYGYVRRPTTLATASSRARALTLAAKPSGNGDLFIRSTRLTASPVAPPVIADAQVIAQEGVLASLVDLLFGGVLAP